MQGQMEGWSSGLVHMKVDGLRDTVLWCVELVRVANLVNVMARAESVDPLLGAAFPIVLVRVEFYPATSIIGVGSRDPIVELGLRMRDTFLAEVTQRIRDALQAVAAANTEFDRLKALTGGEAAAGQPQGVAVP